jgi:hypothetical protein
MDTGRSFDSRRRAIVYRKIGNSLVDDCPKPKVGNERRCFPGRNVLHRIVQGMEGRRLGSRITRAGIDLAVAGIEASMAATGTLGAGIVTAVAESVTPVAGIGAPVVGVELTVARIAAPVAGVESSVAKIEAAVAVFLRRFF